MIVFFLTIYTLYFLLLMLLREGWRQTMRRHKISGDRPPQKISVVIPFRNEEKHIKKLLTSLHSLDYPRDQYEIIGVDDHSTDGSGEKFCSMLETGHPDRVIQLNDTQHGKKMALTEGIKNARGNIIAVTDADCTVSSSWLTNINKIFADKNVKMAFGKVAINLDGFYFSTLQSMEFASLIGVGGAAMGWDIFILCSAANMAFLKSSFEHLGGYENNLDIPSGDDMFLAEKMLTTFRTPIRFYNDPNECVMTAPESSIRGFIYQRMRWAGKWKYISLLRVKLMAVGVLFVHMTTLALVLSMLYQSIDVTIGLMLLMTKIIAEGVFLWVVMKSMHLKWNGKAFLTLQFIYPLYILTMSILTYYQSYYWKDRKLRHKTDG